MCSWTRHDEAYSNFSSAESFLLIDISGYFVYSMFQDAPGERKGWKKMFDMDQGACVCVYIHTYGPVKFEQSANPVGRWILQKMGKSGCNHHLGSGGKA